MNLGTSMRNCEESPAEGGWGVDDCNTPLRWDERTLRAFGK